jgi:hypothetical protein
MPRFCYGVQARAKFCLLREVAAMVTPPQWAKVFMCAERLIGDGKKGL